MQTSAVEKAPECYSAGARNYRGFLQACTLPGRNNSKINTELCSNCKIINTLKSKHGSRWSKEEGQFWDIEAKSCKWSKHIMKNSDPNIVWKILDRPPCNRAWVIWCKWNFYRGTGVGVFGCNVARGSMQAARQKDFFFFFPLIGRGSVFFIKPIYSKAKCLSKE